VLHQCFDDSGVKIVSFPLMARRGAVNDRKVSPGADLSGAVHAPMLDRTGPGIAPAGACCT